MQHDRPAAVRALQIELFGEQIDVGIADDIARRLEQTRVERAYARSSLRCANGSTPSSRSGCPAPTSRLS